MWHFVCGPGVCESVMTKTLPRVGLLLLLALCSCSKLDQLRDNLHAATPHERYVESLRGSGLAATILGGAWIAQGERALRTAPLVSVPFREAGFFRESEVRALAVRFAVRRGEAITATLSLSGGPQSPRVFLDLYALPDASDSARAAELAPPRRVASADSGAKALTFETPRTGAYLLRVQPELL